MRYLLVRILIIIFLILVPLAFLSRCAERNSPCKDHSKEMIYWEDKSAKISFNDILSKQSLEDFKPKANPSLNLGYSKSAFWYYWKPNFPHQSARYWLVVDNPLIDYLDFYQVEEAGTWIERRMGDNQPFTNRIIPIRPFSLRLTEGAYQKGIFIRIQSEGSIRFPMEVCKGDVIIANAAQTEIAYGLFYGSILFISIYQLLSYFYSRNITFLTYSFFGFTLSIFLASHSGHLQEFFYPTLGGISNYINHISSSLSIVFGTYFIYSFFPFMKENKIYRTTVYVSLILSGSISFLTFLIPYSILSRLIPFHSLAIVIFYFVILAKRKLNYSEKWIRRGIIVVLISIIIAVMRNYSLIPNSFFTLHIVKISQFIQVLFFALATSSQYKMIEQYALTTITEKNTALKLAKSKSEILAYLSHEIRSPIHSMLAYLELLTEKENNNENKSELKLVQKSAEHVVALISNILEQSRLEAGKVEIQKETFYLQTLIDDITLEQRPIAKQKELILEVVSSEDLPKSIWGDPLRIHQVLTNLISNAIKFTKSGKVILSIAKWNDQICFSVTDSGLGIKSEEIESLFDEFKQANHSIYKQFGGTGLGLSISKSLLNLMGSDLKLKTEMGVGSEFYFLINIS